MAVSAIEVARYAWLGYLHIFFVLHQSAVPLPHALRVASLLPGGSCPAMHVLPADSCRPIAAGGGVRRNPPTATELQNLAQGFRKLQSAAASQHKTEARDALIQLSWHWNKAVLDHASTGDELADLAATHAVDIAASTWPYWLAWPETHSALALVLGSEMSASMAVDQARTRFQPQRWQGWWRERRPHDNGGDGYLGGRHDPTAYLPPPRRFMPFASMIMLCVSLSPLPAFHCTTLQTFDIALVVPRC